MTKHLTLSLSSHFLDAAVALAEGEQFIIKHCIGGVLKRSSEGKQGALARDDFETLWVDEPRCLRLYKSFTGEMRGGFELRYSSDPALAWPIIDRERIELRFYQARNDRQLSNRRVIQHDHWKARRNRDGNNPMVAEGPNGLVAAMRAHVFARFGEWVELPDVIPHED